MDNELKTSGTLFFAMTSRVFLHAWYTSRILSGTNFKIDPNTSTSPLTIARKPGIKIKKNYKTKEYTNSIL
jgi:hypothetical protein